MRLTFSCQSAICLPVFCLMAACGPSPPPDPGAVLPPPEMENLLGPGVEIAYRCGDQPDALVTLFEEGKTASIRIEGVTDGPGYMACSSTRVGPECSSASFRGLINIVENMAEFSDSETGFAASCTEMEPS